MKLLIQSIFDDMDCYNITLDSDGYIIKHTTVDIDDLILDDHNINNILNTKPVLENCYFQIEPSYWFNAWEV